MTDDPTTLLNSPPRGSLRAACLLSGGLDSQLAVCVLRDQGVEVVGVTFDSPFFSIGAARRAAKSLSVSLRVIDFSEDIIELVEAPPHGFGAGMNPCRDCHARMIRRVGERLDELGCAWIATGEVLNQRPLSQNRRALELVARESGFEDVLLRPLSALRLPETRPERLGWVDRGRLLDLEGRNRKPQMALAVHYGLRDYPTPAGGCRLTEPNYCRRLRDLLENEGLRDARLLRLLRIGRHLRLPSGCKAVVGRNRMDNDAIWSLRAKEDIWMRAENVPGPTLLLPSGAQEEDMKLAASIVAAYADSGGLSSIGVQVGRGLEATGTSMNTVPAEREVLAEWTL